MIRVVIVTDIRLYRDGLVRHLEGLAPFEVIGSAASAANGLDLAERLVPDLLLIDLTIPDCQSAVRALRAHAPTTRVVVLALPDEEQELLMFAEAGVAGFVPRDASLAELVLALESVARSELLVPPRTAGMLLRRVTALSARAAPSTDIPTLTAREAEIAHLIDDGRSNKEIACDLGIEIATVKNHVHHILAKLQLTRRGQVPRRLRTPLPYRSDPRG